MKRGRKIYGNLKNERMLNGIKGRKKENIE